MTTSALKYAPSIYLLIILLTSFIGYYGFIATDIQRLQRLTQKIISLKHTLPHKSLLAPAPHSHFLPFLYQELNQRHLLLLDFAKSKKHLLNITVAATFPEVLHLLRHLYTHFSLNCTHFTLTAHQPTMLLKVHLLCTIK